MKLHQIAPKQKSSRIRRGRGNGSNKGTYAGRGCNGQNARSGGGVRKGFEGGQTPLIQRMPKKRGFRSPNKEIATIVDLSVIEATFQDGEKVDKQSLLAKGVISKNDTKVKILASGVITKKVNIEGIQASQTAQQAIEKAGGSCMVPTTEKTKSTD